MRDLKAHGTGPLAHIGQNNISCAMRKRDSSDLLDSHETIMPLIGCINRGRTAHCHDSKARPLWKRNVRNSRRRSVFRKVNAIVQDGREYLKGHAIKGLL